MGFDPEPRGYLKTILSDLQGAWECLRREVADNPGFPGWERALFHIDEAMSWESVRNLRHMQRCLILVRNILQQADLPEGVAECLEVVSGLMDETLEALASGEILAPAVARHVLAMASVCCDAGRAGRVGRGRQRRRAS
jgi:hypothetical protein